MSTNPFNKDVAQSEMRRKHLANLSPSCFVPCVVTLLIFAALASASLAVTGPESGLIHSQKQTSGSSGNPQNGKLVFEKMGCNQCHGSQGEGVSGAGQNAGVPRIASTPLPLADFLQQVRKPKGQMPPFSREKISDADLADVHAYLQSLKPVAEQPVTAANSSKGERLYKDDGCYECHGLQGQGSTSTGGVRLGPPRIPLSAFVSYIRQPTGQMPPYASKAISDEDLSEIYNFLKSVPPPPPLNSIPLLHQ